MSFVGARIPELRGTGPVFWVVLLLCSLLCSLALSPHAGQLEKADPTDQGHCQQGTSSEKGYKKRPDVSTYRESCKILWVKIFMTLGNIMKISTPRK